MSRKIDHTDVAPALKTSSFYGIFLHLTPLLSHLDYLIQVDLVERYWFQVEDDEKEQGTNLNTGVTGVSISNIFKNHVNVIKKKIFATSFSNPADCKMMMLVMLMTLTKVMMMMMVMIMTLAIMTLAKVMMMMMMTMMLVEMWCQH